MNRNVQKIPSFDGLHFLVSLSCFVPLFNKECSSVFELVSFAYPT
jgi:hypothetical protein